MMTFDPQLQSRFFAPPTEIRHAIYSNLIPDQIHVFCCETSLRLSPCVQHEKDDDANCINQCKNNEGFFTNQSADDPIYIRRLQSNWNTHWRCEEAVLGLQQDCNVKTALVPLFVCKRMLVDFVSAIVDLAAICVCDLETLQVLTSRPNANVLNSGQFLTSVFLDHIGPNIRSLVVDLKLPLTTYEALEGPASSESSSSRAAPFAWSDLPRAFQSWNKLRKLHIRLDHSESISWSLVNERTVLSPLIGLPNLQTSIALPKLNPKYESPDRHFIDAGPLAIFRHYRQRFHPTGYKNGKTTVQYKPDFPILHELADMEAMDDKFHMDADAWEVAILGVEEMEREMILRSEDPRQVFRDLDSNLCTMSW